MKIINFQLTSIRLSIITSTVFSFSFSLIQLTPTIPSILTKLLSYQYHLIFFGLVWGFHFDWKSIKISSATTAQISESQRLSHYKWKLFSSISFFQQFNPHFPASCTYSIHLLIVICFVCLPKSEKNLSLSWNDWISARCCSCTHITHSLFSNLLISISFLSSQN